QRMNLTLDEGNDISVLFDSTPSGNQKCYSFRPRHYFDGRASTTFNQTNKLYGDDGLWFLAWPYTSNCVIGTWGPSNVAVDAWQIGALASQKLPFMYGRNLSSLLSPQWQSDGVFGLALWFHTPLSSKDGSTIEAMLSQYPEKVVSLYLQRRTAPVAAPAPAGFLTIGGKDSQHCSQWTSLPFDPDALGWGATFDSAKLGSATFSGAFTAYFVLTTEYIKTANFDSILRIVGAEYDFRSDQYTVSCDAVAGLPDLVLKLAGAEFRVPASDYARK
ncbi:Protein ASP-7, partial [Aphelenchoides avenae]